MAKGVGGMLGPRSGCDGAPTGGAQWGPSSVALRLGTADPVSLGDRLTCGDVRIPPFRGLTAASDNARLTEGGAMATPVLLSWSGGKDAAWTLHALRADPAVEVVGLLTTVTSGYDRIAMHGIRRALLAAQGAAAGLPVIEAVIPPQCDNATYEASFAAALATAQARWPGLRDIAFGDLFLDDVRA